MFRNNILLYMIFAILALSCSGRTPLAPPIEDETRPPMSGNIQLWGLWDISIDLEAGSVQAVPIRTPQFACNVTHFAETPPYHLHFDNLHGVVNGDYVDIEVDIGLEHPFPGFAQYIGFDVMGVFLGEASGTYNGSYSLSIATDEDPVMLNPDGYTRWFNAPEFEEAGKIKPLFGYYPTVQGTQGYKPNGTLNPYKYFCDALLLDEEPYAVLTLPYALRGSFTPGRLNWRHYEVRRPLSSVVNFQYAVIAHWEPNVHHPDPPTGLEDFPVSANAAEAVAMSIVDSSDLRYFDSGISGGIVILDLSPWDWSSTWDGYTPEYEIRCFSSAWDGPFNVDMTPSRIVGKQVTFRAAIRVAHLDSADPLPVWIEVAYPDLDYSNPLGIPNGARGELISYFRTEIPVSPDGPKPFEWTIEILREGNADGQSIDLVLNPAGDHAPFVTATGQHFGPDPDPVAAQSCEWTGSTWINTGHWGAWAENGTGASYDGPEHNLCMFFARNPDGGDDVWFDYLDDEGWHSVDHVVDGTPTGISSCTGGAVNSALMVCRWPQLWIYTHADLDPTTWSGQEIDSVPGSYSDCWQREDVYYIAYDDSSADTVKLACRRIAAPSQVITVPDPETTSYGSRVGISGYGSAGGGLYVAIVYKDKTNSRLRYAEYNTGTVGWDFSTIASEGNPGEFCSIDFDAAGNRYVAYYVADSGDLWIATSPDGQMWSRSPVDQSADDVGQWCVIKVTPDGLPRIAYGAATIPRKTLFAWAE